VLKVLRKSTVRILREALAKLRGPLIASSSSAVLFLELGVREFEGRTISLWLHEILSYEKCPEEVNLSLTIVSRDFAKGECQSLILQLARSRVARGVSTWALANGYMWRALTRKEALPVSSSRGVGVEEEEPRVSDSRIAK
jgi:hypothetical protein